MRLTEIPNIWRRASFGWAALVRALVVSVPCVALLSPSPMVSSAAPAGPPPIVHEEKHLSVYTQQSRYGLNIYDRAGQEYVDLVNLIEPLGAVDVQYGGTMKVRLGNVEGKFKEGKSKVKIGPKDTELPGKVLLESGRILIPLRGAETVLSLYTGFHADLHYPAQRLFLSDTVTRYSPHLYSTAPGGVRLDFTNPVNPVVSTDGNKLKLTFTREPVLPGTENVGFSDKVITSLAFKENKGNSEITVTGVTPLIARFGDAGKSITIVPAPSSINAATAAASPSAAPSPVESASQPAPPPAAAPVAVPLPRVPPAQQGTRSLILIDPSHGGDERGTAITSDIAEKDVTLEIARRLRSELQKKNVRVALLRDGDVRLSLDQRAAMANAMHPLLYVVIHAGGPGAGVRVYITLLNGGGGYGSFVPWEWAQASFADRSRLIAGSMLQELKKIQVPAVQLSVPVRPLNNVAAPAVAIEVSSPEPAMEGIRNASYQEQVAQAMATAILNSRGDLKDKPDKPFADKVEKPDKHP